LFGVFYPPLERVYLVPVGLNDTEINLRLAPPRNNQRRRIRWAADFEVAQWSKESLLGLAPSTAVA
jgi:hypothetical protein